MGFENLTVAETTIEVPNSGSFTVRGLSLVDISALYRRHGKVLGDLFNSAVEGEAKDDGSVDLTDFSRAGDELLQRAPELAAAVIACAGGDLDMTEKVSELPAAVQIQALEVVGNLTFVGEDGGKKLIETVIRMVTGMSGLAKTVKGSNVGSGASGAR